MSDSANNEAFLAVRTAYAKAKRKFPRLYVRYANAPPDERVELWLDELEVEGWIANLKCNRTTAWDRFIPSAARSGNKIQVQAAYRGKRLVVRGLLISVGVGGAIDGTFTLLLDEKQNSRHFAAAPPNSVS